MHLSLIKNPRLWLGALLLLHLLITLYRLPPADLVTNPPLGVNDYTHHFYDAHAASELLEHFGQAWGYDPYFMAGYPAGTIFDIDNKFAEAVIFAASALGLSQPLVYNLLVLLAFILFPCVILLTARNLKLSPWASTLALALALAVWYLDRTATLMWRAGLFSFLTTTSLSALVVTLFYIYLENGTWRQWAVLAVITTLTLWIHPTSFIILCIPIAILYLLHVRRLPWKRHLALYGIILVVLAVNAYWLTTFVRFMSLLTRSSYYLPGGLDVLSSDLKDLLFASTEKPPPLMAVRWTVLALGLIGVWRWWRTKRDSLTIAFAAAIVSLTLIAYFAIYLPQGNTFEPYRYIVPAMFFAVFPAGAMLADAAFWRTLRGQRPVWKFALAGICLIVLLGWARAAYYRRPLVERLWRSGMTEDRLVGTDDCQKSLLTWMQTQTTRDARILIEDIPVGALAPYFVERELIGGPYQPYRIQHGFANIGGGTLFGRQIDSYAPKQLYSYLQTYNIQWIITKPEGSEGGPFLFGRYISRKKPTFLSRQNAICDYEVYRVALTPTFFLQGSGQVKATYNSIQVRGASPGGIVLKYHWLNTLQSDPPLKLEPYPVLNDPVGFIRVQNGEVRDFVISNRY